MSLGPTPILRMGSKLLCAINGEKNFNCVIYKVLFLLLGIYVAIILHLSAENANHPLSPLVTCLCGLHH